MWFRCFLFVYPTFSDASYYITAPSLCSLLVCVFLIFPSCMTNLMLLLIMELPTPSSKIFVLLGLAPRTSIKIEGSRYTPSDSIYSAHNSWPAYQGGHWFNFSGLICQLIRAEADGAGHKRKPALGIGNAQTNMRKLRKSYTQSKKNRREYCRVCTHPSFISLDEPLMINSDQCMRLKLILPK